MAEIYKLRISLLDHPLYSPDLAQSDFFLFLNLKIARGGQIFMKWGGHDRRKQLFSRERSQVLFKRIKYMVASLREVLQGD